MSNRKKTTIYIPDDVILRERQNSFLKNLIITKIGCWPRVSDHLIYRDRISEYVLLLCTDGEGWIDIGGRKRPVMRGDAAFCDACMPHGYGTSDTDPWSIYWVHFIGEGIPELFKTLDISVNSPIIPLGHLSEAAACFDNALMDLSDGYSLPHLFSASTQFQEFFCQLIRERMYSGLKSLNHSNPENIIAFMKKNLHENCTLEQFSDYMKMSKFHFSRSFKQKTGYSPMEFYNRLKIQKACELLETSSLSVKEISGLLSFRTPFYFSEVFKRTIGHSPVKYRSLQGSHAGKADFS